MYIEFQSEKLYSCIKSDRNGLYSVGNLSLRGRLFLQTVCMVEGKAQACLWHIHKCRQLSGD